MPTRKAPNVEPIRGYRLLEPLGQGGFGEVWKCEAPGGINKAIKFVYGDLNGLENQRFAAEEELRAFQLIKSIRHPFLLSIDRVEAVDGELIIITELADHNLDDLKAQYQAQGFTGIPRSELLAYLREAGEVLDLMNGKFDLQHLDIKPRNLFLVSNHVKVADFGLVNRLSSKEARVKAGAVTPLYAAPELFEGKLTPKCDQYSLAIVYQELLTGTLPFTGEHPRQLMMKHLQQPPDLKALPETDWAIVAKALAKDPDDRYPSCLEFLRALTGEAAPRAVESLIDIQLPAASETIRNRVGDTQRLATGPRPTARAPVSAQVLPSYQFGERVATGPLMDVWKAHGPGGAKRLVKILYGLSNVEAKVKEAVVQLKSIHHPGLVVHEAAHVEPGRVILATAPVKETLRDRFQQCQERKQPGIVRGELMEYLRAVAEVLDYLYMQYGLHHLNLNPRQLVLDQGWLQLAEFGFAQLLWQPGGQDFAARNARYAAPELLAGNVSRTADQYSLALIFAEMLTGTHPFHGLGSRTRGDRMPDLERLAPVDREVIARALQFQPQKRWPSITEMMLALEGISLEKLREMEQEEDQFAQLIAENKGAAPKTAVAGATKGNLNQIIRDIIAKAGGDTLPGGTQVTSVVQDDQITTRFQVNLPLGAARTRLEGFAQPWFGQHVRENEHGLNFRICLPTTYWRRLFHKEAGLDVAIRLARVNPLLATPIEITTTIQTLRTNHAATRDLLNEVGPQIVESLKDLLVSDADKRTQDRLLWPHPLKVTPIDAAGRHDEPIECRGKDISHSGIGFFLPHDLTTSDVLIELPNDVHPPSIAIPATLVRAKRCADGWYEVGALFRVPAMRKSFHEICLPPVNAGTPACV